MLIKPRAQTDGLVCPYEAPGTNDGLAYPYEPRAHNDGLACPYEAPGTE